MKKHDLLRKDGTIIRVLEIEANRVQIIDCIKRTMLVWTETSMLDQYVICPEEELTELTGMGNVDQETLEADQRRIMYERYTLIAPILPFIKSISLISGDGIVELIL